MQEDYNNYNRNNTDENVVYKAHYFSGYKGAIVIKHSIGDSSFSIDGTIFLNRNHCGTNSEVIKHEYGHFLQQNEIGALYYIRIAIPSMLNFYKFDPNNVGPYYRQKWELDVDVRGGVTSRSYTEQEKQNAKNYVESSYSFLDWINAFIHARNYIIHIRKKFPWL